MGSTGVKTIGSWPARGSKVCSPGRVGWEKRQLAIRSAAAGPNRRGGTLRVVEDGLDGMLAEGMDPPPDAFNFPVGGGQDNRGIPGGEVDTVIGGATDDL